jgi:CxxC motif-containing protein
MSTRELVCIVCPNGCSLEVEILEGETRRVGGVSGSLCDKGPGWAEQEILNPVRTIASSVLVRGGAFPLVSVKTDGPVPKGKIFDVMEEIKRLEVDAPVRIGDRLIQGPAGTDCAIVATRHVPRAGSAGSS